MKSVVRTMTYLMQVWRGVPHPKFGGLGWVTDGGPLIRREPLSFWPYRVYARNIPTNWETLPNDKLSAMMAL